MTLSKKICHLTSAHPRNDVRIFFKQCSSLCQAGFDVSLVVADGQGTEDSGDIKIYDVGAETGSRVYRMTRSVWRVYLLAIKLNAELYHFHDPELIFVGLLLKLRGKRVVYDVHEDLPRQILSKKWIRPSLRHFISWGAELIESFSARHFDAIVAATPFIAKRYEKQNKNSVDINNYPIVAEVKEIDSWKTRKNEICYVGGIAQVRGVEELIDALDGISARLNFVGDYKERELRDRLIVKKGWAKVDEYGLVGREEVVNVLARSKIGVVTLHPIVNYLDSLPVKMFEYMLAGIPVVASDFPLWKEIVEGNECGLCVDPLNPSQISSTIKTLLEDDDLASKLGANGRRLVLSRLNWEVEKTKLVDLYGRVLRS